MSSNYQGWSNQETWAMALHMANDSGLNEHSLGYAGAELENYFSMWGHYGRSTTAR